ncbi:MAG TPA: endonuclease/exonuclease/phosphatase family protein [Sphaerochaeta sp.]|nr:endonuclease/exonuclease/phosphatase family protein [Sphaerochaeta sp.]HOR80501.1 endonuclease/exonuclease/phosphatase family protein [Sphaerochaeta sp.]HPK64896.1 endonuclease/exonuclease/phosphatase family protein [Sphaerochaeta sp.]
MRIQIITLNLWNTEYWENRTNAVEAFLATYQADIYCFQEIREETLVFLDARLPDYTRIEGSEPGWRSENTIYVRKTSFNVEAFGRVDLAMPETDRGLFWAKLRTKKGIPLFVGTMHLTHQLNADECASGMSHRHRQAHRAAKALDSLVGTEAAVICGDFNDPVHPSRILKSEAGFEDVFTILKVPAPVTFPCPYLSDETDLVESIDKIMIKGKIRPLLASSPRFSIPNSVLSDHWPVAAVLELE